MPKLTEGQPVLTNSCSLDGKYVRNPVQRGEEDSSRAYERGIRHYWSSIDERDEGHLHGLVLCPNCVEDVMIPLLAGQRALARAMRMFGREFSDENIVDSVCMQVDARLQELRDRASGKYRSDFARELAHVAGEKKSSKHEGMAALMMDIAKARDVQDDEMDD